MNSTVSKNVKRIEETLESAITSGAMDTKAVMKMTDHICTLINSYVDMRTDAIALRTRTVYKTNGTSSLELETVYEDDEHDGGDGVPLGVDRDAVGTGFEFVPKKKRAHLFLICSVCSSVIMIEYTSKQIPEFTTSFVHLPRNGVVYSTCNKCLHAKWNQVQPLRKTDWTRQSLFLDGEIEPNPEWYANLCEMVNPHLTKFPNMIMCRNKPAYVTQDLIKRHTTDDDVIVNVNVDLKTEWYGHPIFSEYTKGSFIRI
jgi:hypothetical protein